MREDVKAKAQNFFSHFCVTRKCVKDSTIIRALTVEDFEDVFGRIPAMDDDRHIVRLRQGDLPSKGFLLDVPGREVSIVVESDLPNGDDRGGGEHPGELGLDLLIIGSRIVGVNPDGPEDKGVLLGERNGLARRLEVGTTFVNSHNRFGVNPEAPFGGTKMSGFGREYGDAGIEAYLQLHAINTPASRIPQGYPDGGDTP